MYKISFLIFLFMGIIYAQEVQLSGYFEHQIMPQELHQKYLIFDYNKLRLDMRSEISKQMTFHADLIWQTQHGACQYNLMDWIPRPIATDFATQQGIPLDTLKKYYIVNLKNRSYVDNAYLSYDVKSLNVRIGKQQLRRGSGYAWNPTDIFHDKNITDPTYEKEGVNAFKMEWYLSGDAHWEGIYSPGPNFHYSNLMLLYRFLLKSFDISICFGRKYKKNEITESGRTILGGDLSGQLLGIGVWVEGAWNKAEKRGDYSQMVIGGDYTLENGTYFLMEYYYNGLGAVGYEQYQFADWLRLLGSSGENLGRHYLYNGAKWPISELADFTIFVVSNLSDHSLLLMPWYSVSLSDNSEISVVGFIPVGKKNREFSSFGRGGFIRLRAYF